MQVFKKSYFFIFTRKRFTFFQPLGDEISFSLDALPAPYQPNRNQQLANCKTKPYNNHILCPTQGTTNNPPVAPSQQRAPSEVHLLFIPLYRPLKQTHSKQPIAVQFFTVSRVALLHYQKPIRPRPYSIKLTELHETFLWHFRNKQPNKYLHPHRPSFPSFLLPRQPTTNGQQPPISLFFLLYIPRGKDISQNPKLPAKAFQHALAVSGIIFA